MASAVETAVPGDTLSGMAADPDSGPGAGPEGVSHAERRWTAIAAVLALSLLGGTLTWWVLREGAYFGSVMYPGLALLAAGMVVLMATAPWRASLAVSGPARLALFSLLALAIWSLISALWSPTPDIAVEDAQRIVGYAIFFALGIWGCALLGRRMELSVLPVVAAALVAALIALIAMAAANGPVPYLEEDGTLQYPLGYRNANAAFFLIALWPALALAGSARVASAVRVGAFVTASACIQFALLSQSRGAIAGVLVALSVYVIFARQRLNALAWLLLAAAPAAFSIMDAESLFDAAKGEGGVKNAVDELNAAGVSGLIRMAIAAVICLVAIRFDPFVRFGRRVENRILIGGAVILALGFVAIAGNPVTWVSDRASEFSEGEADLTESSSRLTFNAGSNRSEIWRVALDVSGDDPVFGQGGGGFQFRFTQERDDPGQLARDAHSAELEMLTELGIVGLVLFLAAMVGAFAGAVRARKLGPSSAQLSCGVLAGGAYWFTHASIDWFWPYPAVTAAAFALFGAAVAPTLLMPERASRPTGRRAVMVLLCIFAITLVPPFLSKKLIDSAVSGFSADPEQAYDNLELARDLNPLTDVPALREGSIAFALGDRERAIDAYREAARKRPEEYAGHFFLALLYAKDDPDQARTELAVVTELNPLEPRIDEIRERIERAERRER